MSSNFQACELQTRNCYSGGGEATALCLQAYDDVKHFETPYVVRLHRFTPLAATQEVFSFQHPNFSPQIDNSRSCTLTFSRRGKPAAICHGFAGYFDAQLYGKVSLLP